MVTLANPFTSGKLPKVAKPGWAQPLNPQASPYFRAQDAGDGSATMGNGDGTGYFDFAKTGVESPFAAGSPVNADALDSWLKEKNYNLMSGSDGSSEYRYLTDGSGSMIGDPQSFRLNEDNGFFNLAVAGILGAGGAMTGGFGLGGGAAPGVETVGAYTMNPAAVSLPEAGAIGMDSATKAALFGETGYGAGMTGLQTAAYDAAMPSFFSKAGTALSNGFSNLGDKFLGGLETNPLGTLSGVGSIISALGGGPKAPSTDFVGGAKAQAEANKDTALFNANLNRPDQITPYGSMKWSLRPGADPKNPQPGDWIQTTALSPDQQSLMDAQTGLSKGLADTSTAALGRVQSTLANPLDTSGAPARASLNGVSDETRARIEEALMSRLEPGFARDEESLRSRLLNTGFEQGSEGWNRELERMAQQRNDGRMQAIINAGQEMTRQSNLDLNAANFTNNSRSQALQEMLNLRNQPLAELNSLRTGAQPTAPTFSNVPQQNASGAPVLDALIAQANQQGNNFNNSQQGYNALLAALAGMNSAWTNGKP